MFIFTFVNMRDLENRGIAVNVTGGSTGMVSLSDLRVDGRSVQKRHLY